MDTPLRLDQLDLNLLYTFCAVVDSGGVLAASRHLGRTQPAVTARIRKLEAELGVVLFERVGRRLHLTATGRAIEAKTRNVLSQLRAVADCALAAQTEPVGTLKLGALPTVGAYLLSEPIVAFTRMHSEVAVDMEQDLTDVLLSQLKAGDLDAVVSLGPPPDSADLAITVLGKIRPRLAMRKTPGAVRPVSIAELSKLDYIEYPQIGDLFFAEIARFLSAHGIDQRSRVNVLSILSIKGLIAAGAGVSILPGYTIVEPELSAHPVRGLSFTHPIWCAVRQSATAVPLVREFNQHLATSLRYLR